MNIELQKAKQWGHDENEEICYKKTNVSPGFSNGSKISFDLVQYYLACEKQIQKIKKTVAWGVKWYQNFISDKIWIIKFGETKYDQRNACR